MGGNGISRGSGPATELEDCPLVAIAVANNCAPKFHAKKQGELNAGLRRRKSK
jgi:hypothetical protein